MREPRRELGRSLGVGRLPGLPPCGRASSASARWVPDRESDLRRPPGLAGPAHLYVPEGLDRPAPAVLFYPGHWWPDSKARPDFQAFCINMARLGFVVLSFDPFGQEAGRLLRDHRRTEAASGRGRPAGVRRV